MSDESNQPDQSGKKKDTKNKRSQSQIEQSRENGKNSKGPVSKEGKAASRRNALKHGLTAKFLAPPKDFRNQDDLYEQMRQELINEYQPDSFTAQTTVSNLANDYVQLIRCRQMMETLQQPAALLAHDRKRWERTESNNRARQMMSDAIECLVTKSDLSFPLNESRILAEKVAKFVRETERDYHEIEKRLKASESDTSPDDPKANTGRSGQAAATDPADDQEAGGDPEPQAAPEHDAGSEEDLDLFTPEELEEIPKQWKIISTAHRLLANEDYLVLVFSGNAVPSSVTAKRLLHILKWMEQNLRMFGADIERELEAKISARKRRILRDIANEPEQIMLLERYLRDIERSIDRKMKQLEERQASAPLPDSDDS